MPNAIDMFMILHAENVWKLPIYALLSSRFTGDKDDKGHFLIRNELSNHANYIIGIFIGIFIGRL